jgi:hypothetical protein
VFQPNFSFVQIAVMAKTRFPAGRSNPWLIGIHFPRMEIKNKRFVLLDVDFPQGRPSEPVRENSKISTSANGNITAKEQGCGNGVFLKIMIRQFVFKTWRFRYPIVIVEYGKNGRIPPETQFLDNIQSP